MLQQEFESRTGVKVSVEEYKAIEVVYNNSDVDKDTFCDLWKKMNKSRVVSAKEEAKENAEREVLLGKLFDIKEKLHKVEMQYRFVKLADSYLTIRDKQVLDKAGINYNCHVSDLEYRLINYLRY